jgi:hypothetical protein
MNRSYLLITFTVAIVAFGFARYISGQASSDTTPVSSVTLPPDYREWKLISVAHEEGNLNDLRAILGNDIAYQAARDKILPFPNGAIIARVAWRYTPSEENNKVFGREQSLSPDHRPTSS